MVAGGAGARFGGQKQFLDLDGMSVVGRSVAAARSVAEGVVLVVPHSAAVGDGSGATDGNVAGGPTGRPASGAPVSGEDMAADMVIAGGATRSLSVRAGLAAVPVNAVAIIVHDAARPLASPALFSAVIAGLAEDGVDGVIPVIPVTDTLKLVSAGTVRSTVDRTGVVSVQTPQGFAAPALRAAHAGGSEASDDAGLLELMGATVRTVPGDPSNLKLTYPEDLALARAFLQIARHDKVKR
ncbi:MAG: IspD/TarI family cytidylyltransferase [Acidimicrobiales bacterium]